ncbi:MAG: flagellum-specific ATP synthase FliI, partial [Nitrosomonas sp.]|nr:flagellum-specific ATP synthase FliI [Nitrosomonas sp.]
MTHNERWRSFLKNCGELATASSPHLVSGTITRVTGLVMEATGLKLAVGSSCTIFLSKDSKVAAEVVGFSGDRLFLMPSSDVYGLAPGARVIPTENLG